MQRRKLVDENFENRNKHEWGENEGDAGWMPKVATSLIGRWRKPIACRGRVTWLPPHCHSQFYFCFFFSLFLFFFFFFFFFVFFYHHYLFFFFFVLNCFRGSDWLGLGNGQSIVYWAPSGLFWRCWANRDSKSANPRSRVNSRWQTARMKRASFTAAAARHPHNQKSPSGRIRLKSVEWVIHSAHGERFDTINQ